VPNGQQGKIWSQHLVEVICLGNAEQIIRNAIREGRTSLLEPEAKEICLEFGIPVTNSFIAKNEDEAARQAKELGFPVVLKIVSPDILHKSDVGGVVVGLSDEEHVRQAFRNILHNVNTKKPGSRVVGILVAEMAPQSTEVIVGMVTDPQFGPALMFGLGGIFVEVLKDVTFRIAPITEVDAREMIEEIKAFPILKGYRGYPQADLDSIVRILMAVSKLVMERPEINQLDLNPIEVYEKGAKVVDARIIIASALST